MKNNSNKPIRVILTNEYPIVRAGVQDPIQQIPGVEMVTDASDGWEAIVLAKSYHPHVVFLDISRSGPNGLDSGEHIVEAFPQV